MKPVSVSTPGRIYRRGQLLRQCYQYDERKYFLSRILMPQLDKKRMLESHRRTISERRNRSHRSQENSRTLEPLRLVVSRCLENQEEQMRRRNQGYWDKVREQRIGREKEYRIQTGRLRRRREERDIKGKYDFLLQPKSCRIFN